MASVHGRAGEAVTVNSEGWAMFNQSKSKEAAWDELAGGTGLATDE